MRERLDSRVGRAMSLIQADTPSAAPGSLPSSRPPHAVERPERSRTLLQVVLLLVCAGGAAYAAFTLVLGWVRAEENGLATRRLAFYASALDAELARVEALPGLVALDLRVSAALDPAASAATIDAVNAFLASASQRSNVEAIFLMDPSGLTLASSNHGQSGSFVGQNYAFRPYFQDAMRGQLGRYYAVGATTSRPGYFLAHPVAASRGSATGASSGPVAGVLVVKASLQGLERLLETSGDGLLLADQAGVVFLASSAGLRYRTLGPIPEPTRQAIVESRQYGQSPLEPLVRGVNLLARPQVPRVGEDELAWGGREVIVKPLGPLGWRLVALADAPHAHQGALLAAAAAALGVTSLWLALWHHLRVRARRTELLGLEIEVRQRIAGSTRELAQRLESQQDALMALRRNSDAAVQTGKLAVLGQMSAALSHELNQPITALMNQADSAALLMSRGATEEAQACLVQMRALADRMANILSHLRDHARRDGGTLVPTDARRSLQAALMLVGVHGGQHPNGVRLQTTQGDEAVMALAEPVRLEQVFVNLIRNAVEAACGARLDGRVHVLLLREGGQVIVEVHDNGPGLAPEVQSRLFEPFFTTKAAGAGLGLGLAVSRMIIEGMGGRLEARNALAGGAVFSVRLPEAQS